MVSTPNSSFFGSTTPSPPLHPSPAGMPLAPTADLMNKTVSPAASADIGKPATAGDRQKVATTAAVDPATLTGDTTAQAQETDRSLTALNALVAASFTQGYTARATLPSSPSTKPPTERRYTSIIPPALTDFAAAYPQIAIASLGALSAATFLGAGALTARLIRGKARFRPDARLDEMERRIVAKIQLMQRKHLDGLNGALKKLEGAELQKGLGAGEIASEQLSLGGLTKLEAADLRLTAVVQDALNVLLREEDLVVLKRDDLLEMMIHPREFDRVEDSINRLETTTIGILDEIKLLKASRSDVAAPSIPPEQEWKEGVMSMSELSDAVQRFQEQARELNAESAPEQQGLEGVSAADVPPMDGQSSLDELKLSSQNEDDGAFVRAMHAHEMGGKQEAAEVVAEELGKAVKAKKKKGRRSRAPDAESASLGYNTAEPQAEESVGLSSEQPLSNPSIGVEAADTPSHQSEPAQAAATSSPEPELDPLHSETSASADPIPVEPRSLPVDDALPQNEAEQPDQPFESATASASDATKPKRKVHQRSTTLPPPAAENFRTGAVAPKLGVDATGAWSFHMMSRRWSGRRDWLTVEIMLIKRVKERVEIDPWTGQRATVRSADMSCQLVQAPAYHNPDLELLVLDGGVWQCFPTSQAGEFTIGDRLGDA